MMQNAYAPLTLISFDPFRTLGIPGVRSYKPEEWFRYKDEIKAADWLLFPEYWQVNPLVYGWKKRIFPSISSYHVGHNKIEMTRAFESVCPNNVPYTRIGPSSDRFKEEILDEFSFPFVAKEVKSSMGQGVFLLENRKAFLEYCLRNETLYIQEYLPIQRDLRVVTLGGRIVTAYWRYAAEGSFHNNVAKGGTISVEDIPEQALQLVQSVADELGIDYAGFDVAEVDNQFYLLEFNVRFGGRALANQGIKLGPLILEYLESKGFFPQEPEFTPLLKAG